jgi:hypothetical protein
VQLQWRYESRPDLGILALAGQLGAADVARLHGAIGWAIYHGSGPLIIDLATVTQWTAPGQDEIVRTSLRLAEAGRPLEIAAAPGPIPASMTDSDQPAIRVHVDLDAALAAHNAPGEPDGRFRQWRSSGWPRTSADRMKPPA